MSSLNGTNGTRADPLAAICELEPIECGDEAAKHFLFDTGYTSLNSGSYGAVPREVRDVFRHFQDLTEARPDAFVRYEYRTHLLNESREALAKYLDVPVGNCVLVPNSTTAFDAIVRNTKFGVKDVAICFARCYGAFENALRFATEEAGAIEKIDYVHPVSDDYICDTFEATVRRIQDEGKTVKIAVFDTVGCLPAVRFPFERVATLCKAHGILSCIDGAHGIGQIPLDLKRLDADFFMSNMHKWLHVPRPAAVLYVPPRNHHLLRATTPISFGFVPPWAKEVSESTVTSAFNKNFGYVGTLDDNPILCIPAALEWRKKLRWNRKQGEEAIMGYTTELAQKGGQTVAQILGTEVLENDEATLGNCSMVNVRLPVPLQELVGDDLGKAKAISDWIMKTMIVEHETAVFIFAYGGSLWTRMSSQVFLELHHFVKAGELLRRTGERATQGEWKA